MIKYIKWRINKVDNDTRKSIKRTILTEFIIIVIFGSLLHFVFDWTSRWHPAALISAVNESTWEHLKLAFWPAMIIMLFQIPNYRKNIKNFFIGKTASFYIMPLSIIIIFYGYTSRTFPN